MVNHYLLLDKLYSIGLNRHALLWCNAYLHNIRQCVVFQGFQSDYVIVEMGVPQGSSLGPLLFFSIFINDLPQICLNCAVHLYADDTLIYTSNSDLSQIQNSLQLDFNLVQEWCPNNMLTLNKRKSCCMMFGSRCLGRAVIWTLLIWMLLVMMAYHLRKSMHLNISASGSTQNSLSSPI